MFLCIFNNKQQEVYMPNKNPTGYTKPYTIYSDNEKMDTSGMANEPPMDMMIEEVTIMKIGPITKYGSGGKVYRNKNDEDDEMDMMEDEIK